MSTRKFTETLQKMAGEEGIRVRSKRSGKVGAAYPTVPVDGDKVRVVWEDGTSGIFTRDYLERVDGRPF
jgi:hypothetical protein